MIDIIKNYAKRNFSKKNYDKGRIIYRNFKRRFHLTLPTEYQISGFLYKIRRIFFNNNEQYDILIYAPINCQGLTTQVSQFVKCFKKLDLTYRVTHKYRPLVKHPLNDKFISSINFGKPRIIIFMENIPRFMKPYNIGYKILYINLDCLTDKLILLGNRYCDQIIYPIKFGEGRIRGYFPSLNIKTIDWPPISKVTTKKRLLSEKSINVLYIGNDFDYISRKNPLNVLKAIEQNKNNKLKFLLKFRSKVPKPIAERIKKNKNIIYFSDEYLSDIEIEHLYEKSHANLIPNESEGLGLSILESVAKGVIPIVLDGSPMNKIINKNIGYLIPITQKINKGKWFAYKTNEKMICLILNKINEKDIQKKRNNILLFQKKLIKRKNKFFQEIIEISKNRRIIDVYVSTCYKSKFFYITFPRIIKAVEKSPYKHRIIVLIDVLTPQIYKFLKKYLTQINIIATNESLGLPFMGNLILDYETNLECRTEKQTDYICYIQDDCYIKYPEHYFSFMVKVYEHLLPINRTGFLSGYYTPIMPAFYKKKFENQTILFSDTAIAVNLFGQLSLFKTIGKMPTRFQNGDKRGNPGPTLGSGYDLWQFRDSPHSTIKQKKTNIIIVGLCEHLGKKTSDSTWNNKAISKKEVLKRIRKRETYQTRDEKVKITKFDTFSPKKFYKR
ncbi:MAG: glycosyltransferase [Nanoarchaeota archaeon]